MVDLDPPSTSSGIEERRVSGGKRISAPKQSMASMRDGVKQVGRYGMHSHSMKVSSHLAQIVQSCRMPLANTFV